MRWELNGIVVRWIVVSAAMSSFGNDSRGRSKIGQGSRPRFATGDGDC